MKKKKKTITQVLKILSPPPDLLFSSSNSASSRPDSHAQVLDDTSSSSQPDTFHPGTSPSQPQPEFVGLKITNEPEEERDMNDLRVGFLERHRKRLNEAFNIVPPPAKRVCLERAEEDPTMKAPPSTMPQLDEAGPSAAAATQLNIAGPNVVAVVQPNAVVPSNIPAAEEARGMKGGPDTTIAEEASDEKSSPARTAPSN